jgi:hypothetical protein
MMYSTGFTHILPVIRVYQKFLSVPNSYPFAARALKHVMLPTTPAPSGHSLTIPVYSEVVGELVRAPLTLEGFNKLVLMLVRVETMQA